MKNTFGCTKGWWLQLYINSEGTAGLQYNEAFVVFFSVMDTAEAITRHRFPNKSLSCHCLCQGKGRVWRGAAAKPRGSVLEIKCMMLVSWNILHMSKWQMPDLRKIEIRQCGLTADCLLSPSPFSYCCYACQAFHSCRFTTTVFL